MCPARARPCLKQKLHSPRLRQQLQSPQLEAGASHTCRPSTACGAGSGRLTQTSKQKKQHFFLQIGHHARPRRARICTPHDEAQARFHARRIFPGDMHMACGPGSPELSKSYMDMASKLFTFTFTYVPPAPWSPLHKLMLLCVCSVMGLNWPHNARRKQCRILMYTCPPLCAGGLWPMPAWV